VPRLPELIEARVTMIRPLQVGDFGFVLTANGIMLGHGMLRVFQLHRLSLTLLHTITSRCHVVQNWREEWETQRHHGIIEHRSSFIPRCPTFPVPSCSTFPFSSRHDRNFSNETISSAIVAPVYVPRRQQDIS
jgi:hypothetical protein